MITIPIYLDFPCCGQRSYRYIKVSGPCVLTKTILHPACSAYPPVPYHNIKINVDWNKSKTKLKAKVTFIDASPAAPWVKKYPMLTLSKR